MNKDEQKIIDLYVNAQWSTYQIAEKFDTYANKIRRVLQKNKITLRGSKDAQKNALSTGRAKHPTKGHHRSENTKKKISEAQGQTIVEDDFQLICFDFVSEPSTPGAFMMKEAKDLGTPNVFTKADRINRLLNEVLDNE